MTNHLRTVQNISVFDHIVELSAISVFSYLSYHLHVTTCSAVAANGHEWTVL